MSWTTIALSHNFCSSASLPMPILSRVTVAAPRGKEEVGLKWGCLSRPTPCTNAESRGACPRTFQAKRAGEAEQRSRGLEKQCHLLQHAEQLSGMVRFRHAVPWYSSETWTRLDVTKTHSTRPLVQHTVELAIRLAESAGGFDSLWSCHSCSSFSASDKRHPSPLAFLLACCSLPSLSFKTARTNGKKPFLFKLQEGFLSSFFVQEIQFVFWSPCELHHAPGPDSVLFSRDSLASFMRQHAASLTASLSCATSLPPWASLSSSGVTLCSPRTQWFFSPCILTASVSHSWKEMA